jgi:histidine triad (HIT) family protein
MADCLICKIIYRTIPASLVYEDDRVLAFNDINPQAPTHVLIVPKRHVATLNDIGVEDDQLVGELVRRAAAIAKERGLSVATGRSSTRIAMPGRRSFTSTCTCSAADR